jgi:hypothetical protein
MAEQLACTTYSFPKTPSTRRVSPFYHASREKAVIEVAPNSQPEAEEEDHLANSVPILLIR